MESRGKTRKEDVVFNMEAVPILQLLFENTPDPLKGEAAATTASVKFMLTRQDEEELRSLGYSREQIDKMKPQEAADILQAQKRAEPGNLTKQ